MNYQDNDEDPLIIEIVKLRKQIINNQQQLLDIRKELIDNKKLESIISAAIFRTSITLIAGSFVLYFILALLLRIR
jgi:hypothetical protein